MTMIRVMCALLAALAIPSRVFAQDTPAESGSHWGIAGTLIPRWEFLTILEDSMEREIEMSGDDVRMGVIRGRQRGGDWGVSYVRRRVDDESMVIQQERLKCVARQGQPDVCASGTSSLTRGARLTGVQLHRFFPVATIARRVQIGAVVSGGIARLQGQAEQVHEHLQIAVVPGTGATSISVGHERSIVDARHIFDDTPVSEYVPMGGVEAALAVLVAPGVKLRFSGGVSFPGFHTVGVTAQYLFGSP